MSETMNTPATLAERYLKVQSAVDKASALPKWAWSRDVSEMLDAAGDKVTRTAHSEELGRLIGTELKGKPYSGSWVRQHVAAYKKFEAGIHTTEDYRAFLSAVNGNLSRDTKPAEEKPTEQSDSAEPKEPGLTDYLKVIRSAVKKALNAGVTEAEIKATLADLI